MAEKGSILGKVALVAFLLYAAALVLLALDQVFGFGLVRPELDRMLSEQIAALGDTRLPQERREAFARSIVSYHEFSVPLLIETITKGRPAVKEPATRCLQEIARTYFGSDITPLGSDPAKLRQWWRGVKEQLEARKES